MHEVAAMRGAVVSALDALRASGAARATRIYLALGASGHLTEDAARQHLTALTFGTPLAAADLEISWLPAKYQCFDCLHQFDSVADPVDVACPLCGGLAIELEHQDNCYVIAIDVSDDPGPTITDEGAYRPLHPEEVSACVSPPQDR